MTEHVNGSTAWPEFLRLWERLLSESSEAGTAVVVEGERDRSSLRGLGIRGPITLVHRGQSLSALSHALSRDCRRVIVLTDWDVRGGHIARRLKEFFSAGGVAFDLDFRRRLARVLRGEVAHVEGLLGWARRMAERSGGPLDHFLSMPDPP